MSSGKRLAGKVAIVTASTDGIGYAIAQRLAQDGASVVVSSRKKSKVDAAVQSLKSEGLCVSGLVCHAAKKEDRKKLIEQTVQDFGGIDILVCNAAANPYFGPMLNTPEDAWDKVFEVNLKAAFLMVQEVVPYMEARGGGAVVMVGSVGGYALLPMLGVYNISKLAMVALMKTLSQELGPSKIRVNLIAPGIIKTHFSEALWKNESAASSALLEIPLGRFGNPDDCSGITSFLVSDDASYITGESIVVAGGSRSRL